MELGLKENPNVTQRSITIPGAGDSGTLEETPGVIYPLLVSKKKNPKIPNNSSDGSDTIICRAGQIVESVCLDVIYWEAVGKKKKKIPRSHHQLFIAAIQALSGQMLDGKRSCRKAPCAGTQHPADLPRL